MIPKGPRSAFRLIKRMGWEIFLNKFLNFSILVFVYCLTDSVLGQNAKPTPPNTQANSNLNSWGAGWHYLQSQSSCDCEDPPESDDFWLSRGKRTRDYLRDRIRSDFRFFYVDVDDPSSLEKLDEYDRQAFNEFLPTKLGRASEWYMAGAIDPEAQEMTDFLPDWLRDVFQIGDLNFRMGLSFDSPFEKQNTNLEPGTPPSFEFRGWDESWNRLSINDPEKPREESWLEELIPGDIGFSARLRSNRIGWSVQWIPAPEDVPLTVRYEYFKGLTSDDDIHRIQANLDLLGFRRRDPCNPKRIEFFVSTAYDFDQEDAWLGFNFAANF